DRAGSLFPHTERPVATSSPSAHSASEPDAWESVQRTRAAGCSARLRAAGVLRAAATGISVIQEAGGLTLALAETGGVPVMVAGQDGEGPFGINGLRLARRGMGLAAELRLPFVSLIDTPGAELSPSAEEGGMAREIARCIELAIGLPVPTVAVLLGQ